MRKAKESLFGIHAGEARGGSCVPPVLLRFFLLFRSAERLFPADVTFPVSGASIKRTIIDTREEERP